MPERTPKRALTIGPIRKLAQTDSVSPTPIPGAAPPFTQGTEAEYAARVVPFGATAATTGTKTKPTRPGPNSQPQPKRKQYSHPKCPECSQAVGRCKFCPLGEFGSVRLAAAPSGAGKTRLRQKIESEWMALSAEEQRGWRDSARAAAREEQARIQEEANAARAAQYASALRKRSPRARQQPPQPPQPPPPRRRPPPPPPRPPPSQPPSRGNSNNR